MRGSEGGGGGGGENKQVSRLYHPDGSLKRRDEAPKSFTALKLDAIGKGLSNGVDKLNRGWNKFTDKLSGLNPNRFRPAEKPWMESSTDKLNHTTTTIPRPERSESDEYERPSTTPSIDRAQHKTSTIPRPAHTEPDPAGAIPRVEVNNAAPIARTVRETSAEVAGRLKHPTISQRTAATLHRMSNPTYRGKVHGPSEAGHTPLKKR